MPLHRGVGWGRILGDWVETERSRRTAHQKVPARKWCAYPHVRIPRCKYAMGLGKGDAPPSRGVAAAFIDFTAKAKLVRFESAGAFALHTFPFGFTPGGATGTQGIGICSVEVCS